MHLNVPPDLETLIKDAFRAASMQALKTCSVALLKPRTPRKVGPMRSGRRYRVTSTKDICRPNAESSLTERKSARKYRP